MTATRISDHSTVYLHGVRETAVANSSGDPAISRKIVFGTSVQLRSTASVANTHERATRRRRKHRLHSRNTSHSQWKLYKRRQRNLRYPQVTHHSTKFTGEEIPGHGVERAQASGFILIYPKDSRTAPDDRGLPGGWRRTRDSTRERGRKNSIDSSLESRFRAGSGSKLIPHDSRDERADQ